MTEKTEMMTQEEAELMLEKADAVGEILTNTPSHIVLHVLMSIAADVGVQAKDDITKREFIADCVACLDYWYEDIEQEEQGE